MTNSTRLDNTDEKIKEAEYFLKKVEYLESDGEDNEFQYMFNSFLHSWSSIFDVVLEDYQRSFGLKISVLDDLSIKEFKEHATNENNELACKFIEHYEQKYLLLFGHWNHNKIFKLVEPNRSFAHFLAFLLNRTSWEQPSWEQLGYGYDDCYTALYSVVQDICGWNIQFYKWKMMPAMMSMAKSGFDEDFILQACNQMNLRFANLTLNQIFEQDFLRERVLEKQSNRYVGDHWNEIQEKIRKIEVRTPVYTIAGLMRRKRNLITHRRGGSELLGTLTTEVDGEFQKKTRMLNFLRENYVSEEQGMLFGHFNTPAYTIEICKSVFDKTKEFVEEIKKTFLPN